MAFTLSIKAANEGMDRVIVTSKEPLHEYGKDDEDPIGVKFNAVLQSNKYQQLSVKIRGEDPLSDITDEAIKAANDSGAPILLSFDDCVARAGVFNGNFTFSASAKGVRLATPNQPAANADAAPTTPSPKPLPQQKSTIK